jgi:hypothetical protein
LFCSCQRKKKRKKKCARLNFKKKTSAKKDIFALSIQHSTVLLSVLLSYALCVFCILCVSCFLHLLHTCPARIHILSFYTVLYVRYIANTVRSFFSLLSRRPNDQRKEQKRKETTAEPAIHQHSMYCMRI